MMKTEADARHMLKVFVTSLHATLGETLRGAYLIGSLALGDYDENISDIDLILLLSQMPDSTILGRIDHVRQLMGEQWPQFGPLLRDVELTMVTHEALDAGAAGKLVVCNRYDLPHEVSNDEQYALHWFFVRDYGEVLMGPDPAEVFPYLSSDDFVEKVRQALKSALPSWQQCAEQSCQDQSYSIVTACRGLYVLATGRHTSKVKACEWAKQQWPEYAPLIDYAWSWRGRWDDGDIQEKLNATRYFLSQVAQWIEQLDLLRGHAYKH